MVYELDIIKELSYSVYVLSGLYLFVAYLGILAYKNVNSFLQRIIITINTEHCSPSRERLLYTILGIYSDEFINQEVKDATYIRDKFFEYRKTNRKNIITLSILTTFIYSVLCVLYIGASYITLNNPPTVFSEISISDKMIRKEHGLNDYFIVVNDDRTIEVSKGIYENVKRKKSYIFEHTEDFKLIKTIEKNESD